MCFYCDLRIYFLGFDFVVRDVVFDVWVVCDLVGGLSWEVRGGGWSQAFPLQPRNLFRAFPRNKFPKPKLNPKSAIRDTCTPVRCEGGKKGKNPSPPP
jgi:hypothetical protein